MTDRLNPDALEAAAKALRDDHASRAEYYVVPEWNDTPYGQKLVFRGKAHTAVSAYLAALPAPRTITTTAKLDALPVGSLIHMFRTKAPFLLTELGWESTFKPGKPVWDYIGNPIYFPATVLWVPTEGGGE